MRPPIEENLRLIEGCCDSKLSDWCDTFSCKSMKEMCDYALALEREKAELESRAVKLIEDAFRHGRSFQANLERGTVLITSDQILKDLEQALKEA